MLHTAFIYMYVRESLAASPTENGHWGMWNDASVCLWGKHFIAWHGDWAKAIPQKLWLCIAQLEWHLLQSLSSTKMCFIYQENIMDWMLHAYDSFQVFFTVFSFLTRQYLVPLWLCEVKPYTSPRMLNAVWRKWLQSDEFVLFVSSVSKPLILLMVIMHHQSRSMCKSFFMQHFLFS